MSKRYSIVGQAHRGLDSYLVGTLPGTPVTLVREPDNKFDKNAVQVWIEGKHVGYLAAKGGLNVEIAAVIDREGRDINQPMGNLAADGSGIVRAQARKAIEAKFARSPNSSYPQVEVDQ